MKPPANMSSLPAEAINALPLLRHRLGPALVAIYLHGSAVTGGLRSRSDVDLLAVVDAPLTATTRALLTADLMAVSGLYPVDPLGRRPLEVVIVLKADLEQRRYPARAEFVFGEWLRAALESGAVAEAETSPEYTLLLAQARREAKPLFGPDVEIIVPDMGPNFIRRAIRDLLPDLSAQGDERNVVLTLARMWRNAVTGEFVSKDAAAQWAVPQLSDRAAGVLAAARRAYLGDGVDDLRLRDSEVSQTVEELAGRIFVQLKRPAIKQRNRR